MLQIAVEAFKLFVLRLQYFYNPENYLEITLYIATVWHMSTYLFLPGAVKEPFFLACLCIALVWTNHLFYLKGLPMYGIYTTMFIKVCATVVKVLVLFGIIFLAFILIFFLLNIDDVVFMDTGNLITKVFVMMTGEFEFSQWLVQNSGQKTSNNYPKVPHKEVTYIAFFLFVLVVAIAFTNLLVSYL